MTIHQKTRISMLWLGFLLCAGPLRAQDGAPVDAATVANRRPLSIEIEGPLSFSRIITNAGAEGSVTLDPQTGERKLSGSVREVTGLSMQGKARVRGEPFAVVIISLPLRAELRSTSGQVAELINFKTDIPGSAVLNADGELNFGFGAQMRVKGRIYGRFRGTIPISADYP